MSALKTFENLLAQGRDSAMLRYGLGNECLKLGRFEDAATHLRAALGFDPNYSAAWKLLGKALTEAGQLREAQAAYTEGIKVAEAKGDVQAAKEMTVFARRLAKALGQA